MLSFVLLYQGVNTAAYTGGSDSGMSSGSAMAPSSGRHLLQVNIPAFPLPALMLYFIEVLLFSQGLSRQL